MSKRHLLESLVAQLTDALPSHIGTLKKDFAKNCQAILSQAFTKFDLVTREEFDTQSKVLLRTRKKLDELDAQVKELETNLKRKRPTTK